MNHLHFYKLDNPVWHSLNETHTHFSLNYDSLKCYDPDYCPFGGFQGSNNIPAQIDEYAQLISNFFIVGEKPILSKDVSVRKELVCQQMLLHHSTGVSIVEQIIQLNNLHEEALYQLVNFVQPGYFKNKTSHLGNYYGIIRNGQLVAVTGERMRMNNFVEISAIVTHPEHTGNGYAKQLITYVAHRILEEPMIPYLHVAETNFAAISLYRKLGFEIRRKISFWNLVTRQ